MDDICIWILMVAVAEGVLLCVGAILWLAFWLKSKFEMEDDELYQETSRLVGNERRQLQEGE